MFTQCPECGTVFRVTAAVLRAAQGQVRCGVCDANFDALRFLTDAVEGEAPVPAPLPAAEMAPLPPVAPAPKPPAAAQPPPAPPPQAPAPAPRREGPASRSIPSAEEDRAIAEIAAALARDAELSRRRAAEEEAAEARAEAEAQAEAAEAKAEAQAEEDVNVLEPADVENIVLGGEAPSGEDPAEAALEFNVPPGQWDRVFVAEDGTDTITPLDINLGDLEDLPQRDSIAAEEFLTFIDEPHPAREPARPAAPPPRPAGPVEELRLAEEDPLSRTDEYALLELELADAEARGKPAAATLSAATEPAPEPAPESAPRADAATGGDDDAINIEDAWFDPGHGNAPLAPVARLERAAPITARAPVPDIGPFALPDDDSGLVVEEEPARPPRSRLAAACGAVALALLLLGQLVHHNRDALAAVEGIGPPLGALYARLGRPLEPRWDLGAYDVKQWGAATDNAPGALRLRASVLNRATRAQPYPLLRVTLEDRFGAKVARREFTPAEYLPGRTAPVALLAPGARADADLSLADPGSQAVGFELDVCLTRAGVLSCGTEPRPPSS